MSNYVCVYCLSITLSIYFTLYYRKEKIAGRSSCLMRRDGTRIRELRHQQQVEVRGVESTHCMLYYSYITKVHGCTFEVSYPVSLTSFVFCFLFEIRRFDPACEAKSHMHLLTYTHKQTLRAVVDRLLSDSFSVTLLLRFIVQVYVLFAGICFPLTCLFCLIIFWFEYYSQQEPKQLLAWYLENVPFRLRFN